MTRAYNSDETREIILEVSRKLFLEKGFDNTTLQDIINGLGGLTKGVIYHYFDSKYDILQTILKTKNLGANDFNWHGDTALEKLQNSLIEVFSNFEQQELVYAAAIMLKSPRLLGEEYLSLFKNFLPEIRKIVKEGVHDGSIETDFPDELADLIVLTLNVWIGFQISDLSEEELRRKINLTKLMFEGLGVALITDEMLEVTYELFKHLKQD